MTFDRDEIVQKHHDAFEAALADGADIIGYHELDKAAPATAPSKEVFDGAVQKALVILLKQKLDADPSLNQHFHTTTKNPLWNQLLTAARIKELARAKIVKKGGGLAQTKKLRYDVADLAKTFFGKHLLTEAGLARQKVLDKAELEKLRAACAKIKLTLPETTEPTTTEIFFDEVIAQKVIAAAAAKPKNKKKSL